MKEAKDNFSAQASSYSKFRPTYPDELYNFLYKHCPAHLQALDCATGNGQVAFELSKCFERVEATDISQSQIAHARQAPNIHYSVQRAEQTSFPYANFDLITVGQAYHWFDFEAFGREANRILKPGGIVAIWSYHLFRFNNHLDQMIDDFYSNVTGPYWDNERKWVDDYYKNVPFHFEEIKTDFSFDIEKSFSLADFEGYFNTWSAVRHMIKQEGHNPVDELMLKVRPVWKEDEYKATFPGFIRLGKKVDQPAFL